MNAQMHTDHTNPEHENRGWTRFPIPIRFTFLHWFTYPFCIRSFGMVPTRLDTRNSIRYRCYIKTIEGKVDIWEI